MGGFNFTEDVRMVLGMARVEAARLQHEYVGTEHILLAFTVPGNEFTANLFQRIGANPAAIRATIEKVVRPGSAGQPRTELPYTSRAKKTLELAMVEATELGHSFVGSEHLLLGLLREEKGIAAQVLVDQGVRGDQIRAALLERHSAESNTAQPEFVSRFVTGPADRFALSDGSIFVLTLVWVALWVYFRPDILNWRLIALLLIVVVPPLLLFRFARRARR